MNTQFYLKKSGPAEIEAIKTQLADLAGLKTVEIEARGGRVVISYDPDKTTPHDIRQAVISIGLMTSDVPFETEEGHNSTLSEVAKISLKRAAGRCVFHLCNKLPAAKRPLKRLGMRMKKEWFRGQRANVQIPGGCTMRLSSVGDNYLSFQVFWKGAAYYEPITSLVLRELVWPGDTFFDVGGNIGFFSLLLSAQKPSLRVVAFEPNPKNYSLLTKNVECNGYRNLVCEPLALSDADGAAPFYLADSDMSASLRSDFSHHTAQPIQVKTVTLDSYLKNQAISGRLVIKVDVEGAEDAFFRGAHETISKLKPDIVAEVAIQGSQEYPRFLQSQGYRLYSISDAGLEERTELKPVAHDGLLFLNYLFSVRPPEVLAELFERIRPEVRKIPLRDTSKCAEPDHIHRALYGSVSSLCGMATLVGA